MPGTRHECRLELVAADHRAVDAEAEIPAVRERDGAAEARSEAAGHRRLHGELAGDALLRAHPSHRLEHRRGPAGVDSRAAGVVPLQQDREQVRDEAAMTAVPVLAGEPDLRAVEQLEPAGILPVPEPE